MEFLCLAVLGIFTGCLASLFGLGGGMIIVPAMLYGHYILPQFNFSTHEAIAISVMQMIFSSVFGTIFNIYKKKLDFQDAIFLGLGGLIGAAFSGILVDNISSKHLTLLFLVVSLITFYKFAFSIKGTPAQVILSTQKKIFTLIIIGALTGVFAISLGIGGGVLLMPLLMQYLGFDAKKILPLSLFFIACASISGTTSFLNHGIMEQNILHAGLIIGSFSLIGVLIGSRLVDIILPRNHRALLMILYIVSILATFNKVLIYYEVY
ncbi:hypothetical protein CQA53_02275 [Helicobacter didelphidarum]|uniref:Probable membrane transporter protein n=1 Tax=Helicobacter didelphidarum TaxID=2040648 RepID=A0A3D8IQ36_9HELI|nr:sulfite exporter TauE/SafE family protein [Helicobacter didelphidarum]RDU67100.1 hypothetical protein CQA53_02275 [Helicobacter didelphidarum]